MEVIALDPGVTHLGFVRRVGDHYVHCTTYNLACFSRNGSQLADRVQSFLHFHRSEFSTAEAVVIERQPIAGGGDAAAQLLYQTLRHKVVWVSPQTLHRNFGMAGLDYEGRKQHSVELASVDLSGLPGWSQGRQHDMADIKADDGLVQA